MSTRPDRPAQVDDPIADTSHVCPNCAEQTPSSGTYCIWCGHRFTPVRGERRLVTVLFADMRGFTAFAEAAPAAAVRRTADEGTAILSDAVTRFGGTVDKVIAENGFKVMAIFGAPTAHEDDPERAVRSALAMHDAIKANPEVFGSLQLAIGLMTGTAVYGPVAGTGEFTVLGDTVNTAARFQSAANVGETLVGGATARAVQDAFGLEELSPISMKGKVEPVPAWRVTGPAGERREQQATTSLVGRTEELAVLRRLVAASSEPVLPAVITLAGPAGIGKSRLITHIRNNTSGHRWLRGRCVSYGEGITYWPIIEIIRAAAGITTGEPADEASRKLGVLLESLGTDDLDELRTIAVAVANLVGAPTTPRGTYSAESISRAELFWGLRRLLVLLAHRQPVVAVVEDIHAAEPTLLDFLAYATSDTEPAPLAFIIAGRIDDADTGDHALFTPGDRRERLDLGPLSGAEAAALFADLTRDPRMAQRAELLETAGGNPLFLEEIARMALDIAQGGDDPAKYGAVPVPPNLRGLIGARLDRLPEEERRLLTHAAVIGGIFWSGALATMEATDEETIVKALRPLVDRGLVQRDPTSELEGQTQYRFQHAMLRDVAYRRIPKAERAVLHERCGDWINAMPGGPSEFIEFVGYHFEQAVRLADAVGLAADRPPIMKAAKALVASASRADGRQGVLEADRFYERAAEVVRDRLPEISTEISFRRIRGHVVMGRRDHAQQAYEENLPRAAALDRADLMAEAYTNLGALHLVGGQLDRARESVERAAEIARAAPPDVRARIAFGSSQIEEIAGDPERAVAELEEAIALATEAGDEATMASGYLRLGSLNLNLGRLVEAERNLEQATTHAEAAGNLLPNAIATTALAVSMFYRGPRTDARRLAEQAITWFERTPHMQGRPQALQVLAWVAHEEGDYAEAERAAREALPDAERVGGNVGLSVIKTLVSALLRQGKKQEAYEVAAPAYDDVTHPTAKIIALRIQGFLATVERDRSTMEEHFTAAAEALRHHDRKVELGLTLLEHAKGLAFLGAGDDAAELAAQARAVFEQIDAPALIADTHALLGGRND